MKVNVPVRAVRLSPLVDARMQEMCLEQGLSLSDFLRDAVAQKVGLAGPPRVPEEAPEPQIMPLTWGDEPHVERGRGRPRRDLYDEPKVPEVRVRRLDPEEAMAGVRGVPSEVLEDPEEDIAAGQEPALVLRGGAARCRCEVRSPRMGGRCTSCWGV
jgi:hypothetical protein